jgi:phage terminase small subunit
MAVTNPNGANQYKVDPRQALFLSYYLDTKSKTFSNAYQSALKAGYSDVYALAVASQMPKWLSETIKHSKLVRKAEKNLEEMLEMEDDDVGLKRIKADITKFVLERLNKERYSQRQELGAGGGIKKLVVEFDDGNIKEETNPDEGVAGEPEEQDEDNS